MKYILKNENFIFITIFIILLLSYLNFERFNGNFDEKIREILFEVRGEIETTNQVVIVDIDEKSINELGQWPFSRDYMAQVLVNLTNSGAGIIGMDIIFSENDRSSPSFMAKKLNLKGEFQDNDELLALVVSKTPTILGYYFTKEKAKNSKPKIITKYEANKSKHILTFNNVVSNISPIQESSYSSGFFNAFNDYNGKLLKMPLVLSFENQIYSSLVFEMISVASQTNNVKIIEDDYAIHGLKLSNIEIPTDKNGFMRINFRGGKKSFKYLSFVDVLNGQFSQNDVNGKFILIGSSITTLADLRATVYDLAMPGVEIHANMIDNILKGDFLYKPAFSKIADILLIFFICVLFPLILLKFSSRLSLFIVISFFVLMYASYYYLLFQKGLVFNLFYPMISLILTTIVSFYLSYQKEQKQKEFVKNKFAKKVSLEVANDLLAVSDDSFRAKQKELSIFFSDIRGFTNLSEKFDSPQKLIELLNRYLEPMSEIITKNQGTIDKFIGDAIMAYWNAPCDVENHADKALKSAIMQLEQLEKLNITLKKEFNLNIKIGIGIHTGLAVVGEMGSSGRSDYTIIGDNVNLASRVEGLTKYFDVKLLITEFTKESLTDKYHYKYIASVVVKGKSNAIDLYEVLNESEHKEFLNYEKDYNDAIGFYKNKEFNHAKDLFEKIDKEYPLKINKLYIIKCEELSVETNDFKSINFLMDFK